MGVPENLKFSKGNLQHNQISNRIIIVIIVSAGLLKLLTLGQYPLMDTTESRYAECGRLMAATGDWVTPRYPENEPYWGKPPLSFWLTAALMKLFGVSEFSSRLSPFLSAAAVALITFIFARKFAGFRAGLFAAAVLATTAVFNVMSAVVSTDMALTAAISLAMAAFHCATSSEKRLHSRLWGYVFFAGLGLGLLAKGPLGIVIPFIPIVLWTFITGESRKVLTRIPWLTGPLVMLAIALPWYLHMEQDNKGYLKYFLIGEHIYKYLQPAWSGDLYGNPHREPLGTIWLFFLADTLPWLPMLLAAAHIYFKKGVRPAAIAANPFVLYLVLWTLTPMLFFTLCRNIQMTYILYGMPAFAILTAMAVAAFNGKEQEPAGRRIFGTVPLVITAALVPLGTTAASFLVMPKIAYENSQKPVIDFLYGQEKGDFQIFYIRDRVPFSASFYTRGKARKITGTKKELAEAFAEPGTVYFVARKDNDYAKKFLEMPDKLLFVKEICNQRIFKRLEPQDAAR